MTESMAICIYLMHAYVPELLGTTPLNKVKVMEGFWVIRGVKDALTNARYEKDTSIVQ